MLDYKQDLAKNITI